MQILLQHLVTVQSLSFSSLHPQKLHTRAAPGIGATSTTLKSQSQYLQCGTQSRLLIYFFLFSLLSSLSLSVAQRDTNTWTQYAGVNARKE